MRFPIYGPLGKYEVVRWDNESFPFYMEKSKAKFQTTKQNPFFSRSAARYPSHFNVSRAGEACEASHIRPAAHSGGPLEGERHWKIVGTWSFNEEKTGDLISVVAFVEDF